MQVELQYRRILVPIDFSNESRKAFYMALKYSRQFDCDTIALHIGDVGTSIDDMEKTASDLERLDDGVTRRLNELWAKGGLDKVDRRRVQIEIRGGVLWKQVVRYADENDVDLIVMATSGRTGVKSLFSPSQCERVVRHATCNVLVVKTDEWEATLDAPPEKFKV
jgi:nucleotide-binding universal stress UspA family protein